MNRVANILIFFLGFQFQITAQHHNFLQLNIDNGLAQSQVNCQISDQRGYLWFGTQGGGLSRYDGISFENTSTKDGLSSNFINALQVEGDNILVATRKGVCLLRGKNIEASYGSEHNVLSLEKIEKDQFYLGTDQGLYGLNILEDSIYRIQFAEQLKNKRINAILKDGTSVFFATNKGLYIYKNKNFHKHPGLEELHLEDIKCIAKDRSGMIWVGIYQFGVLGLKPMNYQIEKKFDQAMIYQPQDIFIDAQNKMWIGTQNRGVSTYNLKTKTWQSLDQSSGLSHNNIRSVGTDMNQNIWLASSGGGVNKYLGQDFVHYHQANGLSGDRVYALAIDKDDQKWLSISTSGISTLKNNDLNNYVDGGSLSSKCNHILVDQENRKWFSTSGSGLVAHQDQSFRAITENQGLPGNWIKCSIQDTLGNIWAASFASGIARISHPLTDTMKVKLFGLNKGLKDLFVNCFASDEEGRIWYGTQRGGLGIIQQDTIMSFGPASKIPNTEIRSISFDKKGRVYIATADQGIFYSSMKDKFEFQAIQKNNLLKSFNIYSLVFDDNGHLWAGSESGLDRIIFASSGAVLEIKHYGKSEGFLGIENCHNSAQKDKNGNLWFGTMNGLIKHTPGKTSEKTIVPNLHFEQIMLNYKSQNILYNEEESKNTQLSLPYKNNQIAFAFKGIDVSSSSAMRYQYKLIPIQEEWSPLFKTNQLSFNALPAGNYNFLVRAVNDRNSYSEVLSKKIKVEQSIWKNMWLQLLLGLLILAAVFWLINLKISQIKKSEKRKRNSLKIENEMLQLEQKALQLQMNPHFIFNALNGIQSLVATNQQDKAREQIQNFAQLMRKTLTNSKKQTIELSEEIDSLKKYIEVERFCQNESFVYEIDVEDGLEIEDIEIPPMILQPFVENAIIHGLANKSGDRNLLLQFRKHKDILICEIKDNGIGRKAAEKLKTQHRPGHQSVALEVNRERLQNLKEGLDYNALEIKDIIEEDGTVAGTHVVIRLPLKYSF